MIFYFSGTGNSRYVAQQLGELLKGDVRMITDETPGNFDIEGESLGFVFPVYSWGVPPVMIDFIHSLPETFWEKIRGGKIPVWVVMTCGDEVAMAPEMMTKALAAHGVEPESIWSVTMPNNYVLLPGFDVDPKGVEKKKLKGAPARIKEIAEGISRHSHTIDVVRGSWPRLKTMVVYPLFKKWGIFPRKWKSTPACVGCGICAASCPLKNIEMDNETGIPKWGPCCCSCLACYHSCPRHAVSYSTATTHKGQYHFPSSDKDNPKMPPASCLTSP